MRFGFITFRSHPLDKNLDDYYLTLLQPLLKKNPKYLLGIDQKGTLEQHFHLILSGPNSMDITNLRQKFNSKDFKQFYKKIKDEQLSTYIDPKFQKGCLEMKLVENTLDDEMKILGYCAKEHPHLHKGYTDDEITQAINYHHKTQRIDHSKPLEQNWKLPTQKNAIAIYEDYSKTQNIPVSSPDFFIHATKDGICHMNIPTNARKIMRASLIVRNEPDLPESTREFYEKQLTEEDNDYYSSYEYDINVLRSELDAVMSWLKDQDIEIPEKFKNY